ncbi:ATP-dependent DNA helicase II subunit [Aphelenchoides avenae]|nr:ATP-dependent DNA helicase II subunit [Aphelenchus avenae]
MDGGKHCTIYLVDMGEKMFVKGSDGREHLRVALEACRNHMNATCCTGDLKENASLIFINSPTTNKDAQNVDCVFAHRPLGNLDAEYVKQMDAIVNSKDLAKTMADIVGEEGSGVCNYVEVLFLCQRIFTYTFGNVPKKTIFLFTVNQDPLSGDYNLQKKIRKHADDLRAKDTSIAVFLVDKAEEEIAPIWEILDPEVSDSATIEELNNEVKRKNFARRATTSIPLKLGDGVQLAVGVYHLIKEQTKPTAIPLSAETNEPLERRVHYVAADEDEGEEPLDQLEAERFEGELGFSKMVGGVKVMLERSEIEKLRRFDTPGITILGFKPISCLKPSHHMGSSKYIYPLEQVVEGSSTLYRALYQKCLERDLFVVVRYTQKTNTPPQLAALIPQRKASSDEDADPDKEKHFYEGFHLVELPFAEDKRDLGSRKEPPEKTGAWPTATKHQVDAAKGFVDRLTADFTPDRFTNPVLQQYYKGLETLALDLDINSFQKEVQGIDKIAPYYKNPKTLNRVVENLIALKRSCPVDSDETKPKRGRGKKD